MRLDRVRDAQGAHAATGAGNDNVETHCHASFLCGWLQTGVRFTPATPVAEARSSPTPPCGLVWNIVYCSDALELMMCQLRRMYGGGTPIIHIDKYKK